MARTTAAASSTVLTNWVSLARQRLDAIDDARLRRRFGNRGKAIDAALAPVVLFAGDERALIGRAMHQDAGAEIGGQPAQCAHDVDRAVALACIGRGDRQPGRCAQQIVQAGDGDPGIGRGAAPRGGLRSWQTGRVIGQRERGDLDGVIADAAGEGALPFERHGGDHLVAECDAHVVSSSAGMPAGPEPRRRRASATPRRG